MPPAAALPKKPRTSRKPRPPSKIHLEWDDLREVPLRHHSFKTNRWSQRTAWLETCGTTGHRLLVLLKAASLGSGRAKGREIVVDLDACTNVFAPSRDPSAEGSGCDIHVGEVLPSVKYRDAPPGRAVRLRELETEPTTLMAAAGRRNAHASKQFLAFLIQTVQNHEHAAFTAESGGGAGGGGGDDDPSIAFSARRHRLEAAARSTTGRGSRKSLFAPSENPLGTAGRMSIHANPASPSTSAYVFAQQSGLLDAIDAREWPPSTKVAFSFTMRLARDGSLFRKSSRAAKPDTLIEIFSAKSRCVWRSPALHSYAPCWPRVLIELGQLCRATATGDGGTSVDLRDPLEFVAIDQKRGKEIGRLKVPDGMHWLLLHEGCALTLVDAASGATSTLAIDTCHLLEPVVEQAGAPQAAPRLSSDSRALSATTASQASDAAQASAREMEAKVRDLTARLVAAEREASGYLVELAEVESEADPRRAEEHQKRSRALRREVEKNLGSLSIVRAEHEAALEREKALVATHLARHEALRSEHTSALNGHAGTLGGLEARYRMEQEAMRAEHAAALQGHTGSIASIEARHRAHQEAMCSKHETALSAHKGTWHRLRSEHTAALAGHEDSLRAMREENAAVRRASHTSQEVMRAQHWTQQERERAEHQAAQRSLCDEHQAVVTRHELALSLMREEAEQRLQEAERREAERKFAEDRRIVQGVLNRLSKGTLGLTFRRWARNAHEMSRQMDVCTKAVERMFHTKLHGALRTWALVHRESIDAEMRLVEDAAAAQRALIEEENAANLSAQMAELANSANKNGLYLAGSLHAMHEEVTRLELLHSPGAMDVTVPQADATTAAALTAPAATLALGLLARDLSMTGVVGGSLFLTLSIEVPRTTPACPPSALCSGWLGTKGPLLRRWKPKFFVLGRDGTLYDAPQNGTPAMLHTDGAHVLSVKADNETDLSDGDVASFRIATDVANGRTYHFRALSVEARRSWLDGFRAAGWTEVDRDEGEDGAESRLVTLSAADDATPAGRKVPVNVHVSRHGSITVSSAVAASLQGSGGALALAAAESLSAPKTPAPPTFKGHISDVWRSAPGIAECTDVWGACEIDLDELSNELGVDGGAEKLLQYPATISCFLLTESGDQRLRCAATLPLGDICSTKPSQPIVLNDVYGRLTGQLSVISSDLRDMRLKPTGGSDKKAQVVTVFDGEVRSDELPSAANEMFASYADPASPTLVEALGRQFAHHLKRHAALGSTYAAAQSRLAVMRSQMLESAVRSSSVVGNESLVLVDAKVQCQLLRAQADEMEGLSKVFAYNEGALRTQHSVIERQAALVAKEQEARWAEIERREALQADVLRKQRALQQRLQLEQKKYSASALADNAERLFNERVAADERTKAMKQAMIDVALERVLRHRCTQRVVLALGVWRQLVVMQKSAEQEHLHRSLVAGREEEHVLLIAAREDEHQRQIDEHKNIERDNENCAQLSLDIKEADAVPTETGDESELIEPESQLAALILAPGTTNIHISRHGSITTTTMGTTLGQPTSPTQQLVRSPRRGRRTNPAVLRGSAPPQLQSPAKQRRIPVPRVPSSGLGHWGAGEKIV